MSLFTGTVSHIFDDESCSFLGKTPHFVTAGGTKTTRFQCVEPSFHDSKLLLRDRADQRHKARKTIPEIQETNCKIRGFGRKWERYAFCGVSPYFGKSQNSLVGLSLIPSNYFDVYLYA